MSRRAHHLTQHSSAAIITVRAAVRHQLLPFRAHRHAVNIDQILTYHSPALLTAARSQHWTIPQQKERKAKLSSPSQTHPSYRTTGMQMTQRAEENQRPTERNVSWRWVTKPPLPLPRMPLIAAQMTGQVPIELRGRAERGPSSPGTHADPWEIAENVCVGEIKNEMKPMCVTDASSIISRKCKGWFEGRGSVGWWGCLPYCECSTQCCSITFF